MGAHPLIPELQLWPQPKRLECFEHDFGSVEQPFQLQGVPESIAEIEGFAAGPIRGLAVMKAELPGQAYGLVLKNDEITLEYGDHAGLRYGLRTLRQILSHERVPELEIYDEPSIQTRALMLDISRDRIPTMDTFFEWLNRAANLKANHVQLYLEHSFAYKNHETVWREASPITAEELKQLDDYAHERGIELSVCQNTFGHTERWLMHEPYAKLGNFDNIKERLEKGEGPFSFNPAHPDSLALPLEWGQELRPLLRSSCLNFGGDETIDLGQGASEAVVRKQGLAQVYAQHLKALAEGLQQQGWTCQFWADIALGHPHLLESLPKDLTALAWGYEADSDFERWGQRFEKSGHSWWACPGTSAWRSMVGRRDARSGSIASALSAALKYRAQGMMITEWGDLGHRQTLPWAWLGWSEGLGAAWSGVALTDWEALSRHTFPHMHIGTARWMDQVSAVEQAPRRGCIHPLRGGQLINANLPFVDSLLPWGEQKFLPDPNLWHELSAQYESLESRCPSDDEHLLHSLHQLRWLCERATLRRTGASPKEWQTRGQALMDAHQRLWRLTDREGGLKDSLKHFTKLLEECS